MSFGVFSWTKNVLCAFSNDTTSKEISPEAISNCHFSTICSSSYIYMVSLHSLSSVRGVEKCPTMVGRLVWLYIVTVLGWFEGRKGVAPPAMGSRVLPLDILLIPPCNIYFLEHFHQFKRGCVTR